MRTVFVGKIAFVTYLALYFCALVPAHIARAPGPTATGISFVQAFGGGDDGNHHSETCPVCQLANGLIDLPINPPSDAAFTPSERLPARLEITRPTNHPSRPTSRGPPALS
jgi:hypothetical protein